MENNEVNKLDMKSANIISSNIEKIGNLFPNVIKEGKIDFDALKQELSSELINDNKERYQLTWGGKAKSKLDSTQQTTKTLRPDKRKSLDFNNSKNIYIEGDNLEVLKILQESYLNKVKCIYIDPPYNTGNDFIYNDDYSKTAEDELLSSGQIDEYSKKLTTNTDNNGRFHSDWLSMMYSRLRLARNLLTEDGLIFISIDDNELVNLKKICDEIFGESNFVNIVNLKAKASSGASGGGEDKRLKKNIEYVLIYSKKELQTPIIAPLKAEKLTDYIAQRKKENVNFAYTSVFTKVGDLSYVKTIKAGNGEDIKLYEVNNYEIKSVSQLAKEENISEDEVYFKYFEYIFTTENAQTSIRDRVYDAFEENDKYYIAEYFPVSGRNKGKKTQVGFIGTTKRLVSYLKNVAEIEGNVVIKKDKIGTYWDNISWSSTYLEGNIKYNNGKKPIALMEQLFSLCNTENAIIMDFFSGSASTAHAVLEMNKKDNGNRKYIMVQLPENLDETYKKATGLNKKTIKEAINYLDSINEEHILSNLGIARLKNVALKMNEDDVNIDCGFRVYRVDSSNMKDIYYEPAKLDQTQLNMFESNIKDDRNDEDLLTQVILDLGLTLDLSIEEKNILNNKVYFVAGNSLVACFDNQINIDILNQICEIKPLKVVFRESSFRNDSDKINAYERIKKLSPETEISVI